MNGMFKDKKSESFNTLLFSFFFSITKKKITGLLVMSEMVYND